MEDLGKKFLLGINKEEKTIYFGRLEVRTPRYWSNTKGCYDDTEKQDFSVSFDEGVAFDIDEIDEEYIYNYKKDYWECISAEEKIKMLNDGEITKENVFDNWGFDNDDYRGFKDCSCTDYEVKLKNGQTINFESTVGGQHDIREDKGFNDIIFTDKKAVEMLLKLWDKYHLKNIKGNKEVEKGIAEILERLDKYSKLENIEKFIIDNIKEV